jgi:hypothetical protein
MREMFLNKLNSSDGKSYLPNMVSKAMKAPFLGTSKTRAALTGFKNLF